LSLQDFNDADRFKLPVEDVNEAGWHPLSMHARQADKVPTVTIK
jgi:hypothetical protein